MQTPQWGIEPVPERLRVLGTLDSFLLWTNLGISLLVLVAASYFGLSLKQALLATAVGAVIGNSMLGVAALIGADARVPTMVLQRAPLGQRGSYLSTGLNVLQCLGWSVFEITVIAVAAGALSDRLFGVHLIWIWKLVLRARPRARIARADRVRAPLRAQGRHLGRRGLDRLPGRLDPAQRPRRQALEERRQRRLVLARRRPRDRDHRLVGAARRGLHALRPQPARGVRGRRRRLPRAGALPVRLRRDPRPLPP